MEIEIKVAREAMFTGSVSVGSDMCDSENVFSKSVGNMTGGSIGDNSAGLDSIIELTLDRSSSSSSLAFTSMKVVKSLLCNL